jgi:hypothetical protein
MDPNIKSTLDRNRRRQFGDHERGRQTPDEWSDRQRQKRAMVSDIGDQLFEAEWASGDHEEDRHQEWQDGESAVGFQSTDGVGQFVYLQLSGLLTVDLFKCPETKGLWLSPGNRDVFSGTETSC